ncbi:MAG: rhodanese-like domain-containing protein [Desulfobacterales bacterium]|nr:rhodanese-like domain-containing protein [Desulfobacterales bacterium]
MTPKNIITGLIIIIVISLISAFGINYVSPKGIALFGEWDISKGAVSAKSKLDLPYLNELEIKDIQTAKQIFDKGNVVFVDARVYEDYAEGHIKGAISLPVNRFDEMIQDFLEDYPFSQQIVTYCSGRECEDSHYLAEKLIHMGYTETKIFIDGYPGWEEKGYPVEK